MAQVHQKKDLKPITHERTGLRAHETEGRKEKTQPVKIRKSKKVQWVELGWDTQILGTCNTARMRLRQFKKSTKKHKERRTDTSFLVTQ